MRPVLLALDGVSKAFADKQVLNRISLEVYEGEFLALLGPSGCGKTTALRIIAGLEQPDEGRVLLGGEDVTALPPERRPLNTVFQNYALFPHMNVFKNVAYGLRLRGVSRAETAQRVSAALEMVQLQGYEQRMPAKLSGGERQRVAIARALILEPRLLLLDEPLGALDRQLRLQMQTELKALQNRLGIAFIYITHDQEEALNMADRIALLHNGGFAQIGTPEDIYEHPRTRFAATFIGQTNILQASVTAVDGDRARAQLPGGEIVIRHPGLWVGDTVELSVRAERIDYRSESEYGFDLPGELISHTYVGGVLRTIIRLRDGTELFITGANPSGTYPIGSRVQVFWDPDTAAVVGGGGLHG